MAVREKFCPKCREVKPASGFYKSVHRNDGLSSYCRSCQITDAKDRYSPHPRWKPPEGTKWCPGCESIKPLEEFGTNRSSYDGKQNHCKACCVVRVTASRRKDPTSHRNGAKRYRERHPDKVADNNARWSYGLPRGTYAKMLADQNGLCAICGSNSPGGITKRFHIDHCHKTGVVRGLLCTSCNMGFGRFKDSKAALAEAVRYLEKSEQLSNLAEGRSKSRNRLDPRQV